MGESEEYINRILQELDIYSLDQYTNETFSGRMTFSDLLKELIVSGWSGVNGKDFLSWLWNVFFYGLSAAKPLFLKMLLFSVLFAVLNRFFITKKGYVTEMSFLVIYGSMMVWLLTSFLMLKDVITEGVSGACSFFTALIPTYSAILLISGNATSAGMFYELSFALICALEWLMKLVFLPGIHIYVLIGLVDHLFEEERFSKLADLIESGIKLMLKLSLSAVLGLGAVRSMLSVGQDHITQNTVLKSLSALPGIGNGFRFAEEVVFSCGILVKNCVGIAGILLILLICLVPIVKIFVFTLLYRVLAAVLQPFSDKRIVDGVFRVAKGCELYLKIMVDTMLLFLIDIALLTFTTTYT